MPPYSIPPYKIVVITLPLEGLPFVLYCFKIKLQPLANQMALTAHKFSDCFVMQMLLIDAEQGHVVVFENRNGVHCYSFIGISSSEGESETGEIDILLINMNIIIKKNSIYCIFEVLKCVVFCVFYDVL